MDIAKASNFERYVYDLSGGDPVRVRDLFSDLGAGGAFDVAGTDLQEAAGGTRMVAGASTGQQRLDTIRRIYDDHGIVVDPHTADGVAVGERLRRPGVPMVFLETAQPLKFAATIEEAIGFPPPLPAQAADLLARPQRHETVDLDADQVKAIIEAATSGGHQI